MTLLLSITALVVSLLTALGGAAIARRVRLLELQSNSSIRILGGDAAPATVSLAHGGAFLQDAERSLVLTACGSCVACGQVIDHQLGGAALPPGLVPIVVQPDDDPVGDQQSQQLGQLGWSVRTVDRGSFLALSAGAYPSMVLSEDGGRQLTYLGPVGTPALLEAALQAVVDRAGPLPDADRPEPISPASEPRPSSGPRATTGSPPSPRSPSPAEGPPR